MREGNGGIINIPTPRATLGKTRSRKAERFVSTKVDGKEKFDTMEGARDLRGKGIRGNPESMYRSKEGQERSRKKRRRIKSLLSTLALFTVRHRRST